MEESKSVFIVISNSLHDCRSLAGELCKSDSFKELHKKNVRKVNAAKIQWPDHKMDGTAFCVL